jgi:D-alanyl-D-alanine carboxypeptidase/D-alanyl-D-alanine-endopeptidase (penicillin-binding protein 4)
VVVLCLALGGCGGGSSSTHSGGHRVDQATLGSARHRAHHRRITPAMRRLHAELTAAMKKAGPNTGAAVYDLTAHQLLFTLRPNSVRPPASIEKLYTTVALLRKFSPNFRLHTTVFGSGHLDHAGTWHGNLYLRGAGDPTFGDGGFNHLYELGYGPTTAQLTAQLADKGIHRVTGQVIADESLFDAHRGGMLTDLAPDIPDFGGQMSALVYDHGSTDGKVSPALFAAKQFAATLRAARIEATAAPYTERAPRHARKLASARSPTLRTLIDLMNFRSDDLFAELLTKQLGARFGHGGSIASGAKVITHQIARLGIHPGIIDGSGLSRDDRSSPAQVLMLLRKVWHTPIGHVLFASLPVVGVNGTTRRIGKGTPAQGNCIGKTGTLDYVTNLAGVCRGRSGHMLAYALFIDGPTNETAVVTLLGPMVAAVARY